MIEEYDFNHIGVISFSPVIGNIDSNCYIFQQGG